MADEFLSNSKGGFIQMCRECRKNRDYISSKFIINTSVKKKKNISNPQNFTSVFNTLSRPLFK